MKVIIAYPPFSDIKGTPLLSQNRQYQVFSEKTVIYPVVPAQAATLLKETGHEVLWLDCIAEDIPYDEFLNIIKEEKPDVIAMETKTPVIKEHWKIIDDLKSLSSDIWPLTSVLFGDHVTALPEESFENSEVDFVLTGGDYDFLLLNLCNTLNEFGPSAKSYELRANLESGIWYRENGENNPSTTLRIENTGKFKLNHDLDKLPFIDRDLTKWRLYAYKNGNYRKTPGTYIMSGRDCYWSRCSFCSWPQLYPDFRVRLVENVLDEIGHLTENYPVKEIMDDAGSVTPGKWLRSFCEGIIERGYNRKVGFDCNMRFGSATKEDYKLMKKAGFRFLLFGLESANQKTLDKINKGLTVETIIESCKEARKAGLYPHITIMFGYPWESYEEAKKTLELGKWLLKKDYAYTMQATIVIPYPGTPLFKECKEKDLLYSLNWPDYDMKRPAMKIPFSVEKLHKLVQGMYSVSYNPEFIINKILSIKSMDDIKYFWRAFLKIGGHIKDFKENA
jgi:anaerobic magnesium-protoporphyrin IX monomethyl ester cyclase